MVLRPPLVAIVVFTFLAPVTIATHGPAFDAAFAPKAGNEWWVEVEIDANEPLAGVDARADGGSWVALEKKDWGAWAKSFHVPEGSIVEFRARATTGDSETSGCYQWTGADKVDCPGTGGGDTGGDGSFDPSYDTPGGNEWWVEVYVDANEPLAGVDARADGGPWHELTKRDWGAWAGSFHVPDGSIVEFRATSTDGDTDLSGGYQWPDGTKASSPPDDDGGGDGGDVQGGFDAAFAPKGGSDGWVEVIVDSTEADIAKVEARVDGGNWHTLDEKPWHAWALAMSAPQGSEVDFRATSVEGDTDMSIKYRWTEAEPSDGHGGGFEADFRPKAGNEWWVETFVDGNEKVALVQANVDGGPWHDLEKKSWGAWAGSFHVPDGSTVRFRAMDGDGEADLSAKYAWPDAIKVSSTPPNMGWPHEGSYVVYEIQAGTHESIGGPVTIANATFIYHGSAWQLHCIGYTEQQWDGSREPYEERHTRAPPFGPTDVAVGDVVVVEGPGCKVFGQDDLEVTEQHEHDTRYHGDEVTNMWWYGEFIPEDCRCYVDQADWDPDMGLVAFVGHSGNVNFDRAELEDTDAPIV